MQSGLELSRENIGGSTQFSRRAMMSMSEPHLPSTVDGPEARNSPFTAIPVRMGKQLFVVHVTDVVCRGDTRTHSFKDAQAWRG